MYLKDFNLWMQSPSANQYDAEVWAQVLHDEVYTLV